MDLNLEQKVVIVTGGAGGIGEAVVRQLAVEKAYPVIVDKNEAAAGRLADELKKQNSPVGVVISDLGSAESCRQAVEEARNLSGIVYGLVNNAGTNDGVSLRDGTPEAFLKSLERNLHHYFFMAQACLPDLIKNRGAIVNISSKTALTGQGSTSGYAASKGAQLGLTREWAAEFAQSGVRVNAMIPSEVMTPQYLKWLETFPEPEKRRQEIEKKIPLGNRFTTPEEIADMTVFLLSERAGHITGQYLHVDGGYVHLDRAMSP